MKSKAVASVIGILVVLGSILAFSSIASAQGPPPPAAIYSGNANISTSGKGVPNGKLIYAVIGTYKSDAVAVSGGAYSFLKVAPPDTSFNGQTINFYIGQTKAAESATFTPGDVQGSFKLTFPANPETGDINLTLISVVAAMLGLVAVGGGVVMLRRSRARAIA